MDGCGGRGDLTDLSTIRTRQAYGPDMADRRRPTVAGADAEMGPWEHDIQGDRRRANEGGKHDGSRMRLQYNKHSSQKGRGVARTTENVMDEAPLEQLPGGSLVAGDLLQAETVAGTNYYK